MKRLTKISAVLMALLLLVANIAFAASAAADATVQPGDTKTFTLDLGKVYGVNGELTVSDQENFTVTLSGDGASGNKCYFFSQTTEPTQLTYTLTVAAKASAPDGATCTVTLNYEDWNSTGDTATNKAITKTVEVEIVEETEPDETTEPEETTEPSEPTKPSDKVDYSELEKQIKLAKALTPNGYTDASWANLVAALKSANAALSSSSQSVVDKAAADLAAAIAALVKMDYSALEEAIEKAEDLLTSNDLTNIFNDLFNGLLDAKDLLASNNQAAVDAGVEALLNLIQALEDALNALENGGQLPTTPSEPSDPQGEYCNISMHYVWPVLFFISLAVNIALIALAVLYVVKRKKNQADNTPLVDYDIGEDA